MEKIICTNCAHENGFEVRFEIVSFVCLKCHSAFEIDKGKWKKEQVYKSTLTNSAFEVGMKGILDGQGMTIVGIVRKDSPSDYYWYEYLLSDSQGQFKYLSESSGHWVLMHEVKADFSMSGVPRSIHFDENYYQLYEYTSPTNSEAKGCFPFSIHPPKYRAYTYINPPFMLSIEVYKGEGKKVYLGQHIDWVTLKGAFPQGEKIAKNGVGVVQPFFIGLKPLLIIFIVLILSIIGTQLFINLDRTQQNVFSKEILIDSASISKTINSESFELKGGAAPVTVEMRSNVDNSWATLSLALVNENTSEKLYASKDIEYYHGYDGGESWTEGGKQATFNICGVSAGKYHLTFSPGAQDTSGKTYLNVDVFWQKPLFRNVIVFSLIALACAVAVYFIAKNFEKRRWQYSDYSPFDYD